MKKVVLVTGASSGFGKFTALELIKKGYTVYGAARRVNKMQELNEAGGHSIAMDVTNDESVDEGIKQIIKEQGRIDVLVNNAGYGSYSFIETADLEQMKRMYDVNVWGLVRVTQHVLPYMRKEKKGKIINISSIAGKASLAFMGFYSSSKFAVESISDALRQEVGRFGIDVAIIEPGAFSTGFEDTVFNELKEVKVGEAYQPILDNFTPSFKKTYENAPTPEPVVKAIVSAIERKKPKTRYAVGMDAKMGVFMKSLLSDRIFDNMMLSQMNMK
ncbi:oxidoreductase [Aureibacter tunicatorum]|uniref:NADP-dependent 3-hydroxy acid dehydrogenase YdfG n=1 Tax=Aureibacter tunicatorum TaxID=866807 RepID=A0AAE3XS44_9BACT|nr:oxidoreductase [Aureibacter tunicatorum]MDR6241535.1 NADP-dependent 3-hydroxy acid dehydrogenase YdfG [Aureibacter tunicatorum]BDD07241.1 short-chain dehydrogenase/reductase [Aureibacter tunicatorum]